MYKISNANTIVREIHLKLNLFIKYKCRFHQSCFNIFVTINLIDLNPSDWTEVWDFTDRLLHTLEAEEGLVLDVKGTIGSINEPLMSCVWTSLPSWVSFSLVSPPWILFFAGECRDNILCGVDRKPSDHRDIELRLDIRSDIWELIDLNVRVSNQEGLEHLCLGVFKTLQQFLLDTQLLLIMFGCMPEVSKNSYCHCIQCMQVNTLNQNSP